jgi:hypothetical protein
MGVIQIKFQLQKHYDARPSFRPVNKSDFVCIKRTSHLLPEDVLGIFVFPTYTKRTQK